MSQELLDRLDAVIASHVVPNAVGVDEKGRFPQESIDALREAGLLGLVSAPEVGGLGASIGVAAQAVERLARACASTAMVSCMHWCAASVVETFGSAEDRRALTRELSTLAFSEVGSRSHFWAPVSTARAEGDEVVLSGRKSWATSAHAARSYVWSSRPMGGEGASTIWLVPAGAAGLSIPAAFNGLGLRGNESAPVTADGVRIPASARLGADGAGFDVMMGVVLPRFNLWNAACSIGVMEAALGGATAHASATRHAHLGTSIADLPTARAYLAKARLRADQVRAHWQDAIAAVESGRGDAMLRVLEVKASAGDAALEVTASAMRVCGGAAFRKEVGVERAFRDAQAASVMAPTSDVLYDFIGKAICGLPLF